MNIEYFPQFIRQSFPSVANESNETLIEVGKELFTGKVFWKDG